MQYLEISILSVSCLINGRKSISEANYVAEWVSYKMGLLVHDSLYCWIIKRPKDG